MHAAPALAAAAGAAALAAEEMAARPDDPAALEMAGRILAVLESMAGAIRMLSYGEAVAEAEYERGYAAGCAAGRGQRCRLRMVTGGAAGKTGKAGADG